MLDENGQLIYGPDSKPILIGTDKKPVSSDGRPILMDAYNHPIIGIDGVPIAVGPPRKGNIQNINHILVLILHFI